MFKHAGDRLCRMKRAVYLFLMVINLGIFVSPFGKPGFAQTYKEDSSEKIDITNQKNSMVGLTAGSLSIASQRFKDFFKKAGIVPGMEASHIFSSHNHTFLGFSLEIKRISRTGKSTITSRNTFFSLIPISLTGKFLMGNNEISPYLGAGIDLYLYKEKSGMGNTSGATTGFHIEGGVYYHSPLFEFIKIKAALRFSRAVANENNIKVNLGGLEFGVGILYCFDI